jgi:uncharacterized membrane protein
VTPPDWSFNPSAWRERRVVVAAALLGLAIAVYLTLYQLGVVRHVWDPLFGSASSAAVLHSPLSAALPVPDAALGALGYLAETITAVAGGEDRWRRYPWLVLMYGATVVALGMASTALVILQPLMARAWCALCLLSAVISVNLVGPALAETLAALQHTRRAANRGVPLFRALGGTHGRKRAA